MERAFRFCQQRVFFHLLLSPSDDASYPEQLIGGVEMEVPPNQVFGKWSSDCRVQCVAKTTEAERNAINATVQSQIC